MLPHRRTKTSSTGTCQALLSCVLAPLELCLPASWLPTLSPRWKAGPTHGHPSTRSDSVCSECPCGSRSMLTFVVTLTLVLGTYKFMFGHRFGFKPGRSSSNPQNPMMEEVQFDGDEHEMRILSQLEELVIVAGHSVFVGKDWAECEDESQWALQRHQRDEHHLVTLLDHIRVGLQRAISNPRSLVVFSGGQTRRQTGPMSEGQSYFRIAQHCPVLAPLFAAVRKADGLQPGSLPIRVATEDSAMDSFQNLLFSLCRFREMTGHYPSKVTVISWSLKRRRFVSLHRRALKIPLSKFEFIGVDGSVPISEQARVFEDQAVSHFQADSLGCQSSRLRNTRVHRNPYRRSLPYPKACPDLSPFFTLCDSDYISEHVSLPWE